MPLETAHGDRRQASNLLKTMRGGSAQYGLLGLYCFQMEELTFALVRLVLERVRVPDELLLHTDAARLGAHAFATPPPPRRAGALTPRARAPPRRCMQPLRPSASDPLMHCR